MTLAAINVERLSPEGENSGGKRQRGQSEETDHMDMDLSQTKHQMETGEVIGNGLQDTGRAKQTQSMRREEKTEMT